MFSCGHGVYLLHVFTDMLQPDTLTTNVETLTKQCARVVLVCILAWQHLNTVH